MADRVKVLSIDGGGIRGIIPALVLAEVEQRTGKAVADLFDLIAGTSTGGLISLALTSPGEGGRPRWSAEELVGLYEERGPDIFTSTLAQRIRSAGGLLDERYPSRGIESALRDYIGEARLKDALTDVLVTAYDTAGRFPFFFRSARARERADYDFPMRDAGRATSAAPTYFEAARVTDATGRAYSLVDGGVFANNPAMCAYVDVICAKPGAEVLVLSLGTGELTRPFPHEKVKDWGLIEWARPLIDVVFDGVSDTTDFQLRQVLGEGRYWRLQTELTRGRGSDDLDDSSKANIATLKRTGRELVEERSADLDAVCAALSS